VGISYESSAKEYKENGYAIGVAYFMWGQVTPSIRLHQFSLSSIELYLSIMVGLESLTSSVM
jgi:hypothetical protein